MKKIAQLCYLWSDEKYLSLKNQFRTIMQLILRLCIFSYDYAIFRKILQRIVRFCNYSYDYSTKQTSAHPEKIESPALF